MLTEMMGMIEGLNFIKTVAEKSIPTAQCSRKAVTCISNFSSTHTYYSYLQETSNIG